MNELDPKIKNLAKAIRQQESGGVYDRVGDNNTSYGAYQWQKPTWQAHAAKYLGDANADIKNPENQNKAAYSYIADMKSKGYQPDQIVASWNAGEGSLKNDAWKTKVGVKVYPDGKKIKYDTPGYVKSVKKYYDQFEQENPSYADNASNEQIPGLSTNNSSPYGVDPVSGKAYTVPGEEEGLVRSRAIRDQENSTANNREGALNKVMGAFADIGQGAQREGVKLAIGAGTLLNRGASALTGQDNAFSNRYTDPNSPTNAYILGDEYGAADNAAQGLGKYGSYVVGGPEIAAEGLATKGITKVAPKVADEIASKVGPKANRFLRNAASGAVGGVVGAEVRTGGDASVGDVALSAGLSALPSALGLLGKGKLRPTKAELSRFDAGINTEKGMAAQKAKALIALKEDLGTDFLNKTGNKVLNQSNDKAVENVLAVRDLLKPTEEGKAITKDAFDALEDYKTQVSKAMGEVNETLLGTGNIFPELNRIKVDDFIEKALKNMPDNVLHEADKRTLMARLRADLAPYAEKGYIDTKDLSAFRQAGNQKYGEDTVMAQIRNMEADAVRDHLDEVLEAFGKSNGVKSEVAPILARLKELNLEWGGLAQAQKILTKLEGQRGRDVMGRGLLRALSTSAGYIQGGPLMGAVGHEIGDRVGSILNKANFKNSLGGKNTSMLPKNIEGVLGKSDEFAKKGEDLLKKVKDIGSKTVSKSQKIIEQKGIIPQLAKTAGKDFKNVGEALKGQDEYVKSSKVVTPDMVDYVKPERPAPKKVTDLVLRKNLRANREKMKGLGTLGILASGTTLLGSDKSRASEANLPSGDVSKVVGTNAKTGKEMTLGELRKLGAGITKQDGKNKLVSNISKIKDAIAKNETEGVKTNKYTFNKYSGDPKMGNDLGKYQVTEGELATYAKRYLGRKVTKDEFLNSPEMQEKYMDNKLKYQIEKEGLTLRELFAVHRGGIKYPSRKEKQYKDYADKAELEYNKISKS